MAKIIKGEKRGRRRGRMGNEKRAEKERQWKRRLRTLTRGPSKAISFSKIPDLDAETIAIDRAWAKRTVALLRILKVKFWRLGPLETVCSRLDHEERE